MALVMSFASVIGAYADTVQLPRILTVEEETFSGDISLDEVDIPWGTEVIESRAFADSSIRKIYVPLTVQQIEENAFAGTDVVIVSPPSSYAHTYADEHAIPWEDVGLYYQADQEAEAKTLAEEDMVIDTEPHETVEIISLDQAVTEDDVQIISEINELINELNELTEQYNLSLAQLTETASAVQDELVGIDHVESDSGSVYYFPSMTLQVAQPIVDLMDQGVEIVTVEELEDTSATRITFEDSTVTYRYASGDTVYWSLTVPVSSRRILRAAKDVFNDVAEAVERIKNSYDSLIEYVENLIKYSDAEVEQLNFLLFKTRLIRNELQNMAQEESLEQGLGKEFFDKLEYFQKRVKELEDKYEKAKAQNANIKGVHRFIHTLNIASAITSAIHCLNLKKEVQAILDHQHPTPEDMSSEITLELADELNSNVRLLCNLYNNDIALSCGDLAISITLLAGMCKSVQSTPYLIKLKIISLVAKAVASLVLSHKEKDLYNRIMTVDQELHSLVWVRGLVEDKSTGKFLADVEIRSNCMLGNTLVTSRSKEDGTFEIYLKPGDYTLTFSLEGYKSEGFVVTQESWGQWIETIQLEPILCVVSGNVTNAESGSVLVGAEVYLASDRENYHVFTDYSGYYEIHVPEGRRDLVYEAGGYVVDFARVKCSRDQQRIVVVEMNPVITVDYYAYETDKGIMCGTVRDAVTSAPLAGVSLRCGSIESYTNGEGYYELYLLPKRSGVRVFLPGYEDARVIMNPPGGYQNSTYNISLTPEMD